jgi:heptosyltransferase III
MSILQKKGGQDAGMSKRRLNTKRWFRRTFARTLKLFILRPQLQPPLTSVPRSVVILAQEKYGDSILLTPLLRLLKKHLPDIEVHLVAFSRATSDFFQSDSNIDSIHRAKENLLNYLRFTRSKEYDLLINTKDHPSTTFLFHSLLIRAKRRASIDTEYHRGIYDYLLDIPFHTPVILKNCLFMQILGTTIPDEEECRPYLPEKPVAAAFRSFLDHLPVNVFTGINISAGRQERYWTECNWKQFVGAFPHERFIVFSAAGDRQLKKRLENSCENIEPSPDTETIYEAGLITAKLKVLVSPDTALIHAASCFGTPVIGLYGNKQHDLSRFKPFLVQSRIVVSPTKSVQDIGADAVIEAFGTMLPSLRQDEKT